MKEAVLHIFYIDKFGKLHCESQSDFYFEPKDLSVMDMDYRIKTPRPSVSQKTTKSLDELSERERFYQMYAFQ